MWTVHKQFFTVHSVSIFRESFTNYHIPSIIETKLQFKGVSQHQWRIAWLLYCAQLQEHNTKCEAALFNLWSHHNPQTSLCGIKSIALQPVLLRFAQSVNVAQSVRPGISGKQESVRLKLRKSCFCPHSCKAGWPYLRWAVNSSWRFWCSNEQPSLCHTAKLGEGKGAGRVV